MSVMLDRKIVSEEEFELKNRRYMGNKSKLIPFIKKIIHGNCGNIIDSFCDLFAGTGSVSQAFNTPHTKIISNDHLISNYFSLCTFLSSNDSTINQIREKIRYLNSLKPRRDNYFSLRYGGTFYTLENAKKIGLIRNTIDKISYTDYEKQILITSLIYAMDKVANTVGHYDAYIKSMDSVKPIKLRLPKLEKNNVNHNNIILNEDANKIIKTIKSDILYLDPPYNSRQYCDAYHLLENIALWKKLPTFGKAEKIDRMNIKSKYCFKDASVVFEELIMNSKSKHIFLSYNNTGDSRHGRSNSKISDDTIKKILNRKGKLKIFKTSHSEFTTGKSIVNLEHIERLFYCKVR